MVEGITKPSPEQGRRTLKYPKEKKKNFGGIFTVIYTSKNNINYQETSGLGIQAFLR